jgi:ATP-dependent phosphofructokinase / diphosphate-dependent phosphofructokinase
VRVGILTGGGDCPGLNAVIRAIVRKGETVHGDELIGFLDAWDGVMERRTMHLDVASLRGMLPKGGTLLGTRRGSPYDHADGPQRVVDTFAEMGLDALVVIGGNGSLSVACQMYSEFGLPIIGVPKTIDNDVVGTDLTFGFTTAVQIATDAIDRLHTTAESHDRVMVVEVMGRHAGWIATHAGIAGGATVILIPEMPFDIDEVCSILRQRHDRGRYASIVVVAEGAEPAPGTAMHGPGPGEKRYDRFGHVRLGGIAESIAHAIEARIGYESRVVLLGHIQRGGTPTAFDRVLATRYGIEAIDAVHAGAWGQMTALRGNEIITVPLSETVGRTRPVDAHLYRDIASVFFG